LRCWRHRYGIAAPRALVRPQVGWPARIFRLLALSIFVAAAGYVIYQMGLAAAEHNRDAMRGELAALRTQLAQRSGPDAADNRVSQIEKIAQARLFEQVKAVESENLRLKEDLDFFERMAGQDVATQRISIARFRVERDIAPGKYRYRLLIGRGASKRDFVGHLQFVVDARNGDRMVTLVAADDSGAPSAASINFKRFLRTEGSFRIDPDLNIQSVQVRIFQSGENQPRAAERFNFG
jgi:hypothetical protein